MFKRRGQSILEYIIVLTAIVAALVWAAAKLIGPAVDKGMTNARTAVENVANKLPTTAVSTN